MKGRDDVVVQRIGLAPHGLDACGVVHMRNGRHRRPGNVQLLDAPQRRRRVGYRQTPRRLHVGDKQHVGAVVVQREPVRDVLAQHRRRERAERLAKLDLQVQHRLHPGRARIGENRAPAQGARTKLHASLQEADHFLVGE
jgi:hypothetical protein